MICRFLEKRLEILERENSEISGNDLELEYYLIESEQAEFQTEKEYGVEIVEKVEGCVVESKMYRNVFTSRDSALDLVKRLADLTVTPVTLPYVLDDIIGV